MTMLSTCTLVHMCTVQINDTIWARLADSSMVWWQTVVQLRAQLNGLEQLLNPIHCATLNRLKLQYIVRYGKLKLSVLTTYIFSRIDTNLQRQFYHAL